MTFANMTIRYALWATVLFVLLLILLGCATPQNIWDEGKRESFASDQAPRAVARCIARNAESGAGFVTAQERVDEDGSAEVIVRTTLMGSTNVMAVARIKPAPNGSVTDLAIAPDAIRPGAMRERLVKGC